MDKFRNYDVAFSGLKTGKHEFKFEVEFPNKSILESQSNALAIFISTGKLSLVFAFSILLMWVTDTPESSASFS